MSRYRIVESVINHIEPVHSYDDLEIHHPRKNIVGLASGRPQDFEPGRLHQRVDGQFEEVRPQPDGRILVKKDFVLSHDGHGPVGMPAPVEGYVHYLHDKTAALRLYDKPFGEPGAKLLAQLLHMDPRTFHLKDGEHVAYGQQVGVMSDTGTPGVIHAHVEAEAHQFRKYIHDIDTGVITPETYPGKRVAVAEATTGTRVATHSPSHPSAMADGQLEKGEHGDKVGRLQRTLNRLGYRDAHGHLPAIDSDFGCQTEEAVLAFQKQNGLKVDGVIGLLTQTALDSAERQLLSHLQHPQHGLYQQVLDKTHAAETRRHIAHGPHSEMLAGALTVEAVRAGITRVDRVEFNDHGTLARAIQAHPLRDESGLNRVTETIDTRQAAHQSLRESSEQVRQLSVNHQQVRNEEQQRVHMTHAAPM